MRTDSGRVTAIDGKAYIDSLCDSIATARKVSGMSQGELADALGVSQQTVSKWERRRAVPDVALFPAIAATLSIPSFGSVDAVSEASRWAHIESRKLRDELLAFRTLIRLRDEPAAIPPGLHADPLGVGREVGEDRDVVAYEMARVVAEEMPGFDGEDDLYETIRMLWEIPLASLTLLRYHSRRDDLWAGSRFYLEREGRCRPSDGYPCRDEGFRRKLHTFLHNQWVWPKLSSFWGEGRSAEAIAKMETGLMNILADAPRESNRYLPAIRSDNMSPEAKRMMGFAAEADRYADLAAKWDGTVRGAEEISEAAWAARVDATATQGAAGETDAP